MEFQYRAIDDERRSRSPLPPPAAPSTPGSGSADSHGGGGGSAPAECMGNSAVTLWQPDLPSPETAAVDAKDLRRKAEKARIREESEHLELEMEVRSELREEMLRRSWPALKRSARGPDTPAVLSTGTITATNSSLPVATREVHSKANTLATKRKSPDHATEALLVPSSKKQKSTLTCMVCGITANSEKAMQDHLNGKVHKRKVVALPELPKLVPEIEQERGLEPGEEEAMATETLGDYEPTKFMMVTTAGELNEVTQMDGYVLCELCNVRTSDRVTMMCHLQGSKHISNGKKRKPSSKPLGEADGTVGAATSAIGSADPKMLVLEDFSVPLPHNVRRLEGFLLCELCNVKAPSMNGMRQHWSGKKHKNKDNASSDASVNVSTGGKEAAKAQPMDTDTAVISDTVAKVDALLEKSLQPKLSDDGELQEMTVAQPREDIATGDSAKTAGTEMMKSGANSAGAQLNNVCDSDSLTMEVDSVMHPLSRVDGFLICLSCNVKVPSETVMRSHLAGKKHKHKMILAARGKNDLAVHATGADEVQDNSSKSMKANVDAGLVPSVVPQANTATDKEESGSVPLLATPQTKNIVALASMAVDRPAEAQLDTSIVEPADHSEITEEAEGEHAAAGANGPATQTKQSVSTNDTTAAPGKPIKIQVEDKVFTVTRQENGSLSCEVCGVHGCNKDSMIPHLYTRNHWAKASLAEKNEKEQACMAAVAMVDKDGEVGSSLAAVAMVDKDGKVGSSMASEGSGLLVDQEVAVGVCDHK